MIPQLFVLSYFRKTVIIIYILITRANFSHTLNHQINNKINKLGHENKLYQFYYNIEKSATHVNLIFICYYNCFSFQKLLYSYNYELFFCSGKLRGVRCSYSHIRSADTAYTQFIQ